MHARIDHLLSIRDGEPVDSGVAEHVEQCATCSAGLRRLASTRTQLQALPQFDAPAVSWEQIQRQAPRSGAPRVSRKLAAIAAAALAMLSIIVTVALRRNDEQSVSAPKSTATPVEATPVATPTHVDDLVAQSQELDHLLQRLPMRPQIERVSTAATIDTIEQRIQWLDYQLSYAPDSGLNEVQSRQLWRERVELMDSLVKVRYAEAGRSSF